MSCAEERGSASFGSPSWAHVRGVPEFSVSPGQGGMHVNGAPSLMQPPMQGGVPAPGQMAAPVQGPGPGPMAPGGEFGPSCPTCEHTGPADALLCLPPNQRARPCESTYNPILYIMVVLLPEVGCKVGLSLGGTNTKGINLQMLPQELGARRYLGPKERVSPQGWLKRGLISACPLRWDAATGWDAGCRACPLGAWTR